jgi:hypothetical protein
MIRRKWENDFIIIDQPEHARLSGVLAEQWGAGRFARPTPWDEVLLATYEHDRGWVEWERNPTLDENRLPTNFNETTPEVTINNFRRSVKKVYEMGHPYAAALVSRHATNIYELILKIRTLNTEDTPKLKAYIKELQVGQKEMLRALSSKPKFQEAVKEDTFHRTGRFVTALDLLSLILCNGWTHLDRMERVPVEVDTLDDIRVKWLDSDWPTESSLELTPWPYPLDSLEASVTGRRITGNPFDSKETFHAVLRNAPFFEMKFHLVPR